VSGIVALSLFMTIPGLRALRVAPAPPFEG